MRLSRGTRRPLLLYYSRHSFFPPPPHTPPFLHSLFAQYLSLITHSWKSGLCGGEGLREEESAPAAHGFHHFFHQHHVSPACATFLIPSFATHIPYLPIMPVK